MKQHYVFCLLGPDRTGLVDRVTEALRSHQGNLEDSRMAVLGGEFAMMFLCSVPPERAPKLIESLQQVAAELGLLLTHKATAPRKDGTLNHTMQVSVRGADHEGIVHELVHHLVEQGVSVENLESQLVNAPYSGVPLFEMQMRISVPASQSLEGLRRMLQQVGNGLNVDVEVEAAAV